MFADMYIGLLCELIVKKILNPKVCGNIYPTADNFALEKTNRKKCVVCVTVCSMSKKLGTMTQNGLSLAPAIKDFI